MPESGVEIFSPPETGATSEETPGTREGLGNRYLERAFGPGGRSPRAGDPGNRIVRAVRPSKAASIPYMEAALSYCARSVAQPGYPGQVEGYVGH